MYSLASDPRGRCGESLQIQQHPLGTFGMYARVSHILLSLLGPVYFGYLHNRRRINQRFGNSPSHNRCSMRIGRSRRRRPVAWNTAFAIAGATPVIETSPSPLAPALLKVVSGL
jgi:hypothetical protein